MTFLYHKCRVYGPHTPKQRLRKGLLYGLISRMREIIVILHNIRSTHNVGAIFRTAEAAGATKILLTGYTPTPVDRFGRARKDVAKASLGAEQMLAWKHYATLRTAVKAVRAEGYTVVGVEQDPRAVSYTANIESSKTALLMGNEVAGLSLAERRLCDVLIEIPMHGRKESLNVSVAAGIALYQLNRQ